MLLSAIDTLKNFYEKKKADAAAAMDQARANAQAQGAQSSTGQAAMFVQVI
jgi:hypothetical protein